MLKKIFRRVRKGIRDIGSHVEDNPLQVLAGLGLGLGAGILPGGKAFGLDTLLNTGRSLLGNFAGPAVGGVPGKMIEGRGLLGGAQTLGKSLLGDGGIKDLLPFINAFLAKQQYDQEREDILREKAEQRKKYEYVSDYIGSPTGGSPYEKDMFTIYDPIKSDSEGKATNAPYARADGGIAKLNMGGNPYQNNMMKLPVRRAMGGESTGVPGLSAKMSSNQMMNKIEDNPGITAFFPPKMGMISGPGGPKDDKIPAMLSDGEFVFTAKAVDNAGGPRAMYKMMNKLDPESSKGRGII